MIARIFFAIRALLVASQLMPQVSTTFVEGILHFEPTSAEDAEAEEAEMDGSEN